MTENKIAKKRVTSCSVVGARGYSGLELTRLLLAHPEVELTNCFATETVVLKDLITHPKVGGVQCLLASSVLDNLTDIVFLATPAEVSLKLAPEIVKAGKTVIDLSGAFRLKRHDYRQWYGFEHTDSVSLAKAQYGLCPFVSPIGVSRLIANPGCYATAISLALVPLIKHGLIDEKTCVIDAKSGSTGGGKKAAEELLFSEVDGECRPYKVGRHQHYPEIVEAIEMFAGATLESHLVTSLLPLRRGIIAGVYANLLPRKGMADVSAAYEKAFENYDLVEFGRVEERAALTSLKRIVGTPLTGISFHVDEHRLYVFSCIDNLMKGAASQAIENMNRVLDVPLSTGLTQMEALT